jgi:hypothetical protein
MQKQWVRMRLQKAGMLLQKQWDQAQQQWRLIPKQWNRMEGQKQGGLNRMRLSDCLNRARRVPIRWMEAAPGLTGCLSRACKQAAELLHQLCRNRKQRANWDSDRLQLHIYDLNNGAKLADVPMDSPASDLSIAGGVLSGARYHFDNRRITREQE